jgi:FtsP/CotA-like multicopper oxidase with cupredoxin domain
MSKLTRIPLRIVALLLFVGLAVVAASSQPASAVTAPPRTAAGTSAAAALPATTCTPIDATARACELWAKTGLLALPGGVTVPALGYSDTAGGAAQVPGPSLIVNQGETVTVTLHNTLAEPSALVLPGQGLTPDLTGAVPGGDKAYTFVASKPGTYLYEAGLTPNSQHQVAMGMYGALIVRPATPGQAYDSAATAYTDEELLVLSEVDPALNNSADPATFDMRDYAPKYWLINGKTYPETAPLQVVAGSQLLVRYLNAGLLSHSMAVLGLDQTLIAVDANPFAYSHTVSAESIPAGLSADVLVTVPLGAPTGLYPLYDGSMLLHNSGQRVGGKTAFGGMLTFVSIPAGPPGGDITGPSVSGISLAPNPANGLVDVLLSATVSDVGSGDANVIAAEYFIDATGANGAGLAMTGAFGSPTVDVSATLTTADLAVLSSGAHIIYVHGQDANGNWGAFNFAVLNLETSGPMTTGVMLMPNPSNGSVDVQLSATADDSMSGGSNIMAAEYWIDMMGPDGTGTAMTVNLPQPIASITATIPAATVAALAEGVHMVHVHSQDAQGNWGMHAMADLLVDKSGPDSVSVTIRPNPNNGTVPFSLNNPTVRVEATVNDPLVAGTNSNVAKAEGFIDLVGAPGTGFPMMARDSTFNSPSEAVYAQIPLSTVQALAEGDHPVCLRGLDAAGNWGAVSCATLTIDKTKPTVSGASASPNPTNGAVTVTLTAMATDTGATVSNIAAGEWFEGADPGAGMGRAMAAADGVFDSTSEGLTAQLNVVTLGWAAGNHTVSLRAKDAAGNWSTVATVVINVVLPNAIFSDSFESGNFAAWSSAVGVATGGGPGISVTTAAKMTAVGTLGMQALLAGNTPAFVTDTTPVLDPSYHARFYFNPNGALTGNNQQQTIFAGFNAAGTSIFSVQYRRQNAGGGTYQIRAVVTRAGGTTVTNWYTITNNAAHAVEIWWQSGASMPFRLYIDGSLRQTLNNLNTSAYLLDFVRLGPSAGLTAAASGTEYFDAFVSTRNTYIGP